jgi:hypothetical protein
MENDCEVESLEDEDLPIIAGAKKDNSKIVLVRRDNTEKFRTKDFLEETEEYQEKDTK